MKSRMIQNLSAALLLATSLSAWADGGEAGGGGNTIVPLSSRAEVEQAIQDEHFAFVQQFTDAQELLFHLFDCSDNYGGPVVSTKAERDLQNPRVAAILLDFSKDCKDLGAGMSSIPRFEAIEAHTKIVPKEHGPCRTQGGVDREGAVVHPKDPNSPICLSVEALEKLPKELMQAQVLGLIAHEYTHKLGYGEKDAILMQKFFISEIASNRLETRRQLAGSLWQVDKTIQDGIESLKTSDNMCDVAKAVDAAIRDFIARYLVVRDTSLFARAHETFRFNELAGNLLMPDTVAAVTCGFGYTTYKPQVIENLKSVDRDFQEMMSLVPKVIPVVY